VTVRAGLSDADLADLLASAEIACIPSLYEGVSLPAVEAMASGTPLVVSRTGALPEVVGEPGVCADLIPPGDADERAAALGALFDAPLRRQAMATACRARAVS
ncbi:glycosyltransferase, partial [Nocardia farcinica]|uniref:glycosyltransferase n=1 Tax=Nocardia farcinica TaxID=37329 RepID=UPI0018951B40